jgi:hypothetical protein
LAVFVIQLDAHEAILPLAAMMTEFGIVAADEDGRMLALVARALHFVSGLRIGDPLPQEVLTGEASWTVDDFHRDQAVARLTRNLLGYAVRDDQRPAPAAAQVGHALLAPSCATMGDALKRLGRRMTHLSTEELLRQAELLVDDLAYIEALRDWLLRGATRMDKVLTRLARGFNGDNTHKELLAQIRRLTGNGIVDIAACLAVADNAVADVLTAFADISATRALLQVQRDTLYRRWRAWEPFCRAWAVTGTRHDAGTWNLSHDTYHFLAPRYMTVVEWRSTFQQLPPDMLQQGMTW